MGVSWLGVVEVLGLVVLLLARPGLLAVRRRWLARQGGTFECSLRLQDLDPGRGLGARGRLATTRGSWSGSGSSRYSLRPATGLPPDEVRVLETREPDPVEAVSLNADQRIVRIETPNGPAAGVGARA